MVNGPRTRPPQFLRRIQNRPALRRRSSLAVFAQLMLVASGIAFGGALAYFGYGYAVTSSIFALRQLDLRQVPEELRPAVRQRLAPALGANLLALSLDPLRESLEAIPVVESARLRRQLPSGLEAGVELRTTWGVLEANDGSWGVSRDAVILGPASAKDAALPHLRIREALTPALDATRRLPESVVGVSYFADAIVIAESLAAEVPSWLGEVRHLRLTRKGVVVVPARHAWELLLGDSAELATKLAGGAAYTRQRPVPPGATIDLRTLEQVVVSGGELAADANEE